MSATTVHSKDGNLVVYFTDTKILSSERIEMIGKELQAAIPEATNKKLVLNFRGVTFMSSAMITKLLMLHKACRAQGVELKFCEVSQNVLEVFRITKLTKLFDIHDSESKAVLSFGNKGLTG